MAILRHQRAGSRQLLGVSMSISLLDDLDSDNELVVALLNHRKEINKIMKSAKGNKDFRSGYRAYLEGFELTENDLNFPSYQGDYKKGWDAAKTQYPDWQKSED